MEFPSGEKIKPVIFNLIKEKLDELLREVSKNTTDSNLIIIYGIGGLLNSMELVLLIVEIEQAIHDNFNKQVILANEKALSQNNSPFHTIETLTTYIAGLLTEE